MLFICVWICDWINFACIINDITLAVDRSNMWFCMPVIRRFLSFDIYILDIERAVVSGRVQFKSNVCFFWHAHHVWEHPYDLTSRHVKALETDENWFSNAMTSCCDGRLNFSVHIAGLVKINSRLGLLGRVRNFFAEYHAKLTDRSVPL